MKNKIYLAYIQTKTFSGQSAATELIKKSLSEEPFEFIDLPLCALDRSSNSKFKAYVLWFFNSLVILPAVASLALSKRPVLHINLGQSFGSFSRVLWWFLPLRLVNKGMKIVISLHGSLFMSWSKTDLKARIFVHILRTARYITVLGPNQKNKLIQWGLSEGKVLIVPNTTELVKLNSNDIISKHNRHSNEPINLLHLSLLIESKGFPVYLKALEILSRKDLTTPINAVLCGPMAFTQYCTKLKSAEKKASWISNEIGKINNSIFGKVHVEWIQGAQGKEKEVFSCLFTIIVDNTWLYLFLHLH